MTDLSNQAHWNAQADKHGADHAASWGDSHAIELEVETIGRHLREGDNVLDVGCGNGYSTLKQLSRSIRHITGVDYSSGMIMRADSTVARASFRLADARDLPFSDGEFDVVYTTRTLINLPTWEEQKKGIQECLRVAKRKVIFSEGFWEPLVTLNALRCVVGLPPLVEHDFNRYLKKARLDEFLASLGLSFTCEEFSGVYYLGSRFLRELVTDASAYPGYTNPVNAQFFELEREYSAAGFGIQQAYVVTKETA